MALLMGPLIGRAETREGAVFRLAEETAEGARAMIDDGLFDRFPEPAVVFGRHVLSPPAGTMSYGTGTTRAASEGPEVRMCGRSGHGSMPESTVDPVVTATPAVLRSHTVVSHEIVATDAAVLWVGALQAGTKENVIPDAATTGLNVRAFDEGVRGKVLGGEW